MAVTRVYLLPGLDGTGALFRPFLDAASPLIAAVIVLGLAMAIALTVDILRTRRPHDVTASHDHIDERTHPPAVPAKPVCGDESYPPDG